MQADFDDLRFINASDNTKFDYYIEFKIDSTYVDVLVKIHPNITTTNQTIYMYYDNSAASSESNGTLVFDVFDDFDDNSMDAMWTTATKNFDTNATETGKVMDITGDGSGGGYWVSAAWVEIPSFGKADYGWAAKADVYADQTATQYGVSLQGIGFWNSVNSYKDATSVTLYDGTINAYQWEGGNGIFGIAPPNGGGPDSDSWTGSLDVSHADQTWRNLELIWNSSDGKMWYYDDEGHVASNAMSWTNEDLEFFFFTLGRDNPDGTIIARMDNFTLRKYHSPEPTYGFGIEELSVSPPDQPTLVEPANDSVAIIPVTLAVAVTDPDGDYMNVTFYNSTGYQIGAVENVSNGTNASVVWSNPALFFNHTWYVNVTDGLFTVQSPIWTFLANDEPMALNMHIISRDVSSITFEWDNPPDGEWVSLMVIEEDETLRQVITTRDNWTASALKWNRVYNFTHQSGDIYLSIGNYYSFLVKTEGWHEDYLGILDYKRQITVDDVVSADLDNYIVNLTLTDENFDFSKINDTVNGSDVRFVEFEGVNELAYDVTYLNVSGAGGQSMQVIPNSTNCVGNWVDCNKSYDADPDTLASPFIYTEATVYFNYTIPIGAKASTKWTVKDGGGWGWQFDMPDDCFNGDTELKLRAHASYNDTSVEWSCQNNTDNDWVSMRYENSSYHVYYSEIRWYFSALAHISVNVSHLDANYSTKFWFYYGGVTTDNSTTLSGFDGTWHNTTVGSEVAFTAPNPVLSDVVVEEINNTAVNVSWNVTMTSDSRVRYSLNEWFVGESNSEFSNYTDIVVINISGLTTDTTWYFDAVSCDNTNLSNCGNNTANFTLGTLPSMPNVSIFSYNENRADEEVRVCVDLADADGQSVMLYLEYYALGSPYEVFNISDNVNTSVPIIACFTVPVNYGNNYVYRGVAEGNVSTGYSSGYVNEFLSIQNFFAGNPITDDDDNRIRAHSGYREGSCQSEDYMWIETNLVGVGDLRVRWFNGSWTYVPMVNDTDSDMWYLNMSGLDGTWVTFEIWNDTAMQLNWTKPSLNHPLALPNLPERKYVSFGCIPEPISYTLLYLDSLPYYNSVYRWCIASGGNLYECMLAEYVGGGRESGMGADRSGYEWERGNMFRGGITNGESFDTGVLNPERGEHVFDQNKALLPDGYPLDYGEDADISHSNGLPNGSDEYRYCFAFLDFWWNKTQIPSNGISDYYLHFWHSDQMFSLYFWEPQDYRFDFITLFKWEFDQITWTRDFSPVEGTMITERNDVLTTSGTTFNATYDESLGIYYKSFDEITFDSDSDIYDYGLHMDAMWTNVMLGQYQQAFIIFNLPDNATLQGMDSDSDGLTDFDELFVHYTNPKSADTDEGGNPDGQEVGLGMNPNIWTDDDTTPPNITISAPAPTAYGNLDNIPVLITFDGEAVSWTGSQVEGYAMFFEYTNVTSVVGAIAPLPVATYNFTVYANDTLGNMGSESVVFEVYYTGVQQILVDTGSGLGGFLVGITDPTVNLVLALGIIGGIITVLLGVVAAIKGVFSGAGYESDVE